MECGGGHQVDVAAGSKDGQLRSQLLHREEARRCPRFELHQDVDVAVRAEVASNDRAEECEALDAPPAAQTGQWGGFEGDSRLHGIQTPEEHSAAVGDRPAGALEASAGVAASELWSDAGVGNVSLEIHWVFGGRSTHTVGLRGQLELADRWDDPPGPITWWGPVPVAMVPQRAMTLAYAGSVAAWVWMFEVGLGDGPLVWALPSVVAGLATVQPTGGGWSVVGELEARLEPSPVHARVLMRKALNPRLGLDVGVAIPVVGMVEDPTLQVVAQLQGRW